MSEETNIKNFLNNPHMVTGTLLGVKKAQTFLGLTDDDYAALKESEPDAFTEDWVSLGIILTSKKVNKKLIQKIEAHIYDKKSISTRLMLLDKEFSKPRPEKFVLEVQKDYKEPTVKEKVQASIKEMHLRAQSIKSPQEKQAARRKRNQDRRNRRKNK